MIRILGFVALLGIMLYTSIVFDVPQALSNHKYLLPDLIEGVSVNGFPYFTEYEPACYAFDVITTYLSMLLIVVALFNLRTGVSLPKGVFCSLALMSGLFVGLSVLRHASIFAAYNTYGTFVRDVFVPLAFILAWAGVFGLWWYITNPPKKTVVVISDAGAEECS
ncbi:hypothetical protein HY967_04960 [Candidatus Jorgensenbacteria bacterium]|nr:hypothetical protein [Candidatus Jorgensenbacteria bacterium]